MKKKNELIHYGIKGMKWGVRTSVYTKNEIGDSYTNRQKKRMTKDAKNILRKNIKENVRTSELFNKAASENYKKADKHVWTSEKAQSKGDIKKFEKYQGKAWKQLANQHENLQKAENFSKRAEIFNKKVNDIDSGKIKAGKDFVTNYMYSTNLVLDAAGIINFRREREVNFK